MPIIEDADAPLEPLPAKTEIVRPLAPAGAAWRTYAELRRDVAPAEAASRVADGWPLSDAAREDLIARLLGFEQHCALTESVEEWAARVNLEENPEPAPEPDPLAAVEDDATRRVKALEEQRQRVAPEALTDDGARQELLDIESELGEARRAAELAPLARVELARREQAAREDAQREQREAAAAAAVKLLPERRNAAEALDAAARAYCDALSSYRALVEQHARAVEASGAGPAAVRRARFETVRAGFRRAAFDGRVHRHICGDVGDFKQRDCSVLDAEPPEVRAAVKAKAPAKDGQ
ncbi:MAG: hypothetical protein ACYCUM_13635 [Solirubrobacteraceae bacterium]